MLPSLIKIPVRKGACRFPTQRISTQRRQQTPKRSQKKTYTEIDLHGGDIFFDIFSGLAKSQDIHIKNDTPPCQRMAWRSAGCCKIDRWQMLEAMEVVINASKNRWKSEKSGSEKSEYWLMQTR